MSIIKGKTEFLMGIDDPNQLRDWLDAHTWSAGVAFIGRSNVGKSSMINALFGKTTARVSKTPGRTRQVNIFKFSCLTETKEELSFYLFDVPGYGYAEVSKAMAKKWEELLNDFFTRVSDKVVLLNIQDARHPLQESDQLFHEYIKQFKLETYLVFNKMDKLKTQKERFELDQMKPGILRRFKWVKQIHFVSAEKGTALAPLELAMLGWLMKQPR